MQDEQKERDIAETKQHEKIPRSSNSALLQRARPVKHRSDEETCSSVSMEPGVIYKGVDFLEAPYGLQTVGAAECCQRCSDLEMCTHWTWSMGSCSIKQGKFQRAKVQRVDEVLSGRAISAMERLAKSRRQQQGKHQFPEVFQGFQCTYNVNDLPFLPPVEVSKR